MNQRFKLLLYIIGFVILILAAAAGYNYLSKNYKAPGRNDAAGPAKTTTAVPGSPTPGIETTAMPGSTPNAQTGTPDPDDDPKKLKAPDFTALDYEGNEVRLSDYIGTPIVLNFWASWCLPCMHEMPHFNKVSEEYEKDELLFLMVDLAEGSMETVESGKKYIEENGFTFTVLFDTEQDAAVTYGVRSIPCTAFIDKDGYVREGVVGSIDEDTLRYYISLILE